MPNLNGTLTLSEVAHKYSVSPSYINKLERLTQLFEKEDGGYGEEAIKVLDRIYLLRKLGYSVKEITHMLEVIQAGGDLTLSSLAGEVTKRAEVLMALLNNFIEEELL